MDRRLEHVRNVIPALAAEPCRQGGYAYGRSRDVLAADMADRPRVRGDISYCSTGGRLAPDGI